MKAMLAAFAAIIVIAVAAGYGLNYVAPFSSADMQSSSSVRLD